jgi:hypothetical protein
MKLLREFFRLRVAARVGRHADSRRSWTITVPAPLVQESPSSTDMHRSSDAPRGRHAVRGQEHAASQAHRHLQLVSSH